MSKVMSALPFPASAEKRQPTSVEAAQADAFRELEPIVCDLVRLSRLVDYISDDIADRITDEEKPITADPRDILALQFGVTELSRQLVQLRDRWYLDHEKAQAAPKRIHADERLLELHEKLKAAFAKTDETRKPYDQAEEMWFAMRTRTGREPAEDTQEHQDLDRTEKAYHEALEERTNLIETIAEIPANLGDGLDVKIAVLQALLKESKAELSPSIGLSTSDKVAYSLARDVALIRGVL